MRRERVDRIDRNSYLRWKRRRKLKRILIKCGSGLAVIAMVAIFINIVLDGDSITPQENVYAEQSVTPVGKGEAEDSKFSEQNQPENPWGENAEPPKTAETAGQKQEQQKQEADEQGTDKDKSEEDEYLGVSASGKPYIYDAKKIRKKLETYDYYRDEEKVVFLTFDDGTSPTVTPKVLDILKENDVKATFFVIGKSVENGKEKAKELIRREFEEGHAIGNHTYSHDYGKLYPGRSLDYKYFVKDLNKTDKVLQGILGENFRTKVFRCPGGFMSWKNMSALKKYQKEKDKVSIDWNALTKDSEGKKKNAGELYRNMKETSKGKDMVVLLMHDMAGKEETVKALPKIIQYYKSKGYEFRTLG